jgi:hypothetical protein
MEALGFHSVAATYAHASSTGRDGRGHGPEQPGQTGHAKMGKLKPNLGSSTDF